MSKRVTLFLAIVIISPLVVLAYLFGKYGNNGDPVPPRDYSKEIKVLNDTITELRKDISIYKQEIEQIDLERDSIKKELTKIIHDSKKTDNKLRTGSCDDNIGFLSDILSKEADKWERYDSCNNSGTDESDKQVSQ